jgi:hypothetical protein
MVVCHSLIAVPASSDCSVFQSTRIGLALEQPGLDRP